MHNQSHMTGRGVPISRTPELTDIWGHIGRVAERGGEWLKVAKSCLEWVIVS